MQVLICTDTVPAPPPNSNERLGDVNMKMCCPFCKEIHEIGYEEVEKTEKVGNEEFAFIETTISCSKLDIKKTQRKLKDPGRQERLLFEGVKIAYNELPDGLKEKFIKEVVGR